jgi:hypothetical protein
MKQRALDKRYKSGRAPPLERRYERGPGRPAFAEGTARTGVFTLKVSADERAAIVDAAERAGKPVTQWARETLLLAASDPSTLNGTTGS